MDSFNFSVCLSVCLLYILYVQLVSASHGCSCEVTKPFISLKHVRKHALTLEQFDTLVAGNMMTRVYRIVPSAIIDNLVMSINRRDLITKEDDIKYAWTSKYSRVDDASCRNSDRTYVNVHKDKADFYYEDKYSVFHSFCPSSYVLTIECNGIEIWSGFKKCPIENVRMSIYRPEAVVENADDIPWYLIAKEMYMVTGIKFGCGGFSWVWTYGETESCEV